MLPSWHCSKKAFWCLQALQTSGLANGRVFLADVEFKESKPLFHRLGVTTLPWIMHIGPSQSVGADGVVSLKPGEVVSTVAYEPHSSWCTIVGDDAWMKL